jgi:two-component system, LytTR family, response regulator
VKIKSIVIDDEKSNRAVLSTLLKRFCPDVINVGEASDADEAYSLIQNLKPDLVFLDINMPKQSGLSLLNRFDNIPFQTIFVTGHDQYAINAIKFDALDYLLKPIEINELVNATNKAIALLNQRDNKTPQIIHVLNNSNELDVDKSLAIHEKGNVRILKLNDIQHIESDVNYSIIYLHENEKIITTRILKELETILESSKNFIRINKSCLVNINFIKTYSKKEPFVLSLIDGKEFEISRRKRKEVIDRIEAL